MARPTIPLVGIFHGVAAGQPKPASVGGRPGIRSLPMTAPVPTHADLRTVVDDLMPRLARVPDDGWERPAHGLDWDCRDTVAHLMDDFGFYAMQLSGMRPPQEDYIDFLEPP